jgi:starvation-inducible DNA-binding protein
MQKVTDYLKKALASNFCLYLKTQNFHWNVEGSNFVCLHGMFNEQYEQLATASDLIAEHIRTLGELAPASLEEFLVLSEVKDAHGRKNWQQMVEELKHDHEVLVEIWSEISRLCAAQSDEATADLAAERIRAHQKIIWMLRSTLVNA